MDLNLFATQVTDGSKGPLSASATSSILGGTGGLGGVNGLAFLEAILSNISTDGEIETETKNQNTNDNISSEGIKEAVDLTLLQLALLGQDPDKTLDEKLSELKIEKLVQTKSNRVDQLTKLINHLTNGLPQEIGNESSIEDLVSRLNRRLEKLESSLEAFRTGNFNDENAPFRLLIATGLNPAQLTKITQRIEEVETKLGRELTIEDLIAGVGSIIPAPGDTDHEFSTTDALNLLLKKTNSDKDLSDTKKDIEGDHKNLEEADFTDAQINNFDSNDNEIKAIAPEPQILDLSNQTLVTFSQPIINDAKTKTSQAAPTIFHKHGDIQALLNLVAPSKIAPAGTPTNGLQPTNADGTILPEDGITPLPGSLSNAEFKALFDNNNQGNKNITKLSVANITHDAAVPKFTTLGDFSLPSNWMQSLTAYQALSEALGFDVQTGAPFTQTMMAVHTATMTQSAGQTHPGTAMVAAQITKAAQSGEARNITLQLDPPELGRVEVRMEFGGDNKIKAHMIIEKPETYLMLQRDVAALDRALQDAGFDTGSDSLNYQMAEDDYGFGDRKNSQNSDSGTNSASDNMEETEEEIIETTMNWNVDPDTGHVHYNIYA